MLAVFCVCTVATELLNSATLLSRLAIYRMAETDQDNVQIQKVVTFTDHT